MMMNFRESGQAILEVLVALAIGIIIATAFVSLGAVSVRNSTFSRDQVTATQLAQEGIEAMISLRDQDTPNAVIGAGATQWSQLVDTTAYSCASPTDPLIACAGDFQLSTCTIGSVVQHCITKSGVAEGLAGGFSRRIRIIDGGANIENVTALVWWTDVNGIHTSTLTRKLHKNKLE